VCWDIGGYDRQRKDAFKADVLWPKLDPAGIERAGWWHHGDEVVCQGWIAPVIGVRVDASNGYVLRACKAHLLTVGASDTEGSGEVFRHPQAALGIGGNLVYSQDILDSR